MPEFHFTNWFYGLNKRIVKLISEDVDPMLVEIRVQPAFYMNLMYNAVPDGPLRVQFDGKKRIITLHGCKIDPCLHSDGPYYTIIVDGVTIYERTEL